MPADIYKSNRWHVQSFGTERMLSIATLDDNLHGEVWIVPGSPLATRLASILDVCDKHDCDMVLEGFTLAAGAFKLAR